MSITKGFESRVIKSDEVGYYWKFLDTIALLEHARALEAMLKKHERAYKNDHGDCYCWECERPEGYHDNDCQLAKLLEGV